MVLPDGAEAADRAVVWGQSCAALLVTAAAAAAHAKVRPFKYGFQNSLETGLFASDVSVVLLGLLYTVLPIKVMAIEVTLVALLCGALVAGLVYIFRAGRKATLIVGKAAAAAAASGKQAFDRSTSIVRNITMVSMKTPQRRSAQRAIEGFNGEHSGLAHTCRLR